MTRAAHLIVTGGTGYIGAALVARALREGRTVTLLGRRPGPVGTHHVTWALGDRFPAHIPGQQAALVHLAHDWQASGQDSIAATARLFDGARTAGITTRVFISSQSAREHALNRYGRLKWATEQRIGDATSLRVGLVYGGTLTAMYGLLAKLATLPLLPMIEPHRTVQPIHLDEVVDGILAAADGQAGGVRALAGPQQVAFGDVLRLLARQYRGRRLPIIPVPLSLALFACDMTARLPLIPTVDRERVLGLAGTEPIDSAADLAALGVAVRPIGERLAREPAGRRALLAEGRAFLRHAGIAPTPALLRRYARAWPEGAIARPRLPLRWCEPLGSDTPLGRRLRVAARIAEASAPGEAALAAGSRIARLARLAAHGAYDALCLPLRLVLGRA
ncbi:NAD-dependent epimerase/dehydratase family protein [uncultured Sphingomonas sp.]|jgi:nucleoside-diphosphate-sugar epimerase|uniref:NAD-dependent epimerase/dehydratase family protein n=1 Tax=uncultured Sphingomonas sp. TaxID=158754 RepID=UPI0030DDBB48